MQLKPFTSSDDAIDLHADVEVEADRLRFRFRLADPGHLVQDSLVTAAWRSPERADELWRTTCFEAFWGIPGEKKYWELNLSPSRQKWNLYVFAEYRAPQPPTPSDDFDLLGVKCEGDLLQCDLRSKIKLPALEMNLCAVVRLRDKVAYYSAHHAKEKADFHWRGGFFRVALK